MKIKAFILLFIILLLAAWSWLLLTKEPERKPSDFLLKQSDLEALATMEILLKGWQIREKDKTPRIINGTGGRP